MVIPLVSLTSRMTAKLVQSVNDRSLSRYWKKRCRARSKRSFSTRSHRNLALPSICCHHASAAATPEAKPKQGHRLVDDEVGRNQDATRLERGVTGSRAGQMRGIASDRTCHPTARIDKHGVHRGYKIVS